MFKIAWRNLSTERIRLLITVGGVGFAVLLILALQGIFDGATRQITAYIDNEDVEIYVMQAGVKNMHMANSFLDISKVEEVRMVDGVKAAVPVQYVSSAYRVPHQGMKVFSYVIGYDPGVRPGGPWDLETGTYSIKDGQAIVDILVARRHNLELGDRIEIMGKKFELAGFARGTNALVSSMIFLTFDDLARLRFAQGKTSYILVEIDKGEQAEDVADRIKKRVFGVNVLTKAEFSASDRLIAKDMGVDTINAMALVGFFIGIMIIGLTVYTTTLSKIREFAVLKALGANTGHLFLIVFGQALVSGILGLFTGVGLAYLLAYLIPWIMPDLLIVLEWPALLRTAVAVIGMSVAGSFPPISKVVRVDPATVFRP